MGRRESSVFRLALISVPLQVPGNRLKRLLPSAVRRSLRLFLRETPIRVRDFSGDIGDLLGYRNAELRLPPARLRRKVGGVSSRQEFTSVGRTACNQITAALNACSAPGGGFDRWLDFGCGSGRISRHVEKLPRVRDLCGVDIDGDAISWAARYLSGTYKTIDATPPMDFPAARFAVVYAVSVFTHLDEQAQLAWLHELHRILRPGGLLISSTSSPSLSFGRPDLTPAQQQTLASRGFLFAPGEGSDFNRETAFHSNEYLLAVWGRLFGQLRFQAYGLGGYQDLTVWVKW